MGFIFIVNHFPDPYNRFHLLFNVFGSCLSVVNQTNISTISLVWWNVYSFGHAVKPGEIWHM